VVERDVVGDGAGVVQVADANGCHHGQFRRHPASRMPA
jgi:hypothetical protein